jgi:catechol 2,3-dioxygenase
MTTRRRDEQVTEQSSRTRGTATPIGIAAPSYRLPAASHPGLVRLQVAELDRSLPFYQGVLGLRPLKLSENVAILGTPGGRPLVELHARPGVNPVGRGGRLGLFHFAILLPDRADLGRFLTHVAQARVPIGMADHDVSEAIYLSDPDGLGIEVYADRPRERWRNNGSELFMTTEPLDAQDLVRASRGEPWTEVPADTVMGHVHLSVGDLREAQAFYHDALGFDKMVWSYPGALFMAAGGYHHHLATNTWAAGSPRAGDEDARLLEWELVLPTCSDVAAAARSLGEAGYAVVGTEQSARAEDKWGTGVRLVSYDACL